MLRGATIVRCIRCCRRTARGGREACACPEQLGAWPSARAIIVAAFAGSPEYAAVLRQGGAKIDGFAGAALGDRKRVEQTLRDRPGFARERDHYGLTALQCAAWIAYAEGGHVGDRTDADRCRRRRASSNEIVVA